MSDRERARAALLKVEELKTKLRERDRLVRELEQRLQHDAYDSRRRRAGLHPDPRHATGRSLRSCSTCGWDFVPGEEVLEYLDDDGRVVARYHAFREECRRASERHPKTELLYP